MRCEHNSFTFELRYTCNAQTNIHLTKDHIMPHHTLKLSPAIPAIEQCCLTKLDKRFVIIVQFALLALSINLLGAFPVIYLGGVLSLLFAGLFMSFEHVWAFALAKGLAIAFLIGYGFDVIAHIPLVPFRALSNEAMTASLMLSELLGIWLSAMLLTNLRTVPFGALFHPHSSN